MPRRHFWLAAALTALLVPLPARAQSSCTTLGQNTFVRDTLDSYYYWYKELPRLDPGLYTSPEAYLDAVRYRPLDSSFSYISGRAASDAFYSDSQFIGFGFATRLESDSELRVAQVFADSPASEAGLERGVRIRTIDGRTIAELVASGQINSAFGLSEIGVSVTISFDDLAGASRSATMVKRLVTIPTVSLTRTLDVDGRRVAYVHFRNFVQPSFPALDAAFAQLQQEGATELVLDLRYNGGGLVSVAQRLASLIGGSRSYAQTFCQFFHNDKQSARNQTLLFENPPLALNLQRLVVLTTRSSASASELVINALRPFIPVIVVGDRTYGKPVGQYSFNFCDKVLYPVAFTLLNARGEGNFFDGFAPDCAAADDLDHLLGDPAEASLGAAIGFIRTGACQVAAAARPRTSAAELARLRALDGFQQLVGAH
ncbi:MAG: S41 family peptidase [Vicinamibacteria bacterium]